MSVQISSDRHYKYWVYMKAQEEAPCLNVKKNKSLEAAKDREN